LKTTDTIIKVVRPVTNSKDKFFISSEKFCCVLNLIDLKINANAIAQRLFFHRWRTQQKRKTAIIPMSMENPFALNEDDYGYEIDLARAEPFSSYFYFDSSTPNPA